MRSLTKVPNEYKPRATNGTSVLYVSEVNAEQAVMVAERTGEILELPTYSALARGYWTELPENWKPKAINSRTGGKRTRKGSDAK